MSHDLHLSIENSYSGGSAGSAGSAGAPGGYWPQQHMESPVPGELDHLPNPPTQQQQQQQQHQQPHGSSMMTGGAMPNQQQQYYGNGSQQQQGGGGGGGGGGGVGGSTLRYMQDSVLSRSSHPFVIIFHVLFKALALFFYLGRKMFLPSSESESGAHFITLTVVIILLLAADFWVVKNVTGRLLVGLRWWNKVDNETTTWIFESAEDHANATGKQAKQINPFDSSVFWTVLYVTPCVWAFLLFFAIIQLKILRFMIIVMALALSGSNVYGYYRCSKDQKEKIQRMMQNTAQQGAMAVVKQSVMSIITGSGGGGGANGGANNYNAGRPAQMGHHV